MRASSAFFGGFRAKTIVQELRASTTETGFFSESGGDTKLSQKAGF